MNIFVWLLAAGAGACMVGAIATGAVRVFDLDDHRRRDEEKARLCFATGGLPMSHQGAILCVKKERPL